MSAIDCDPIRYFNKKRFLNNISLKCRYDLMDVNKFCKERTKEPANTKMFKVMSLVKLYEDGLINTHARPKNRGFDDLLSRSIETSERIRTSAIYNRLETINHTERHNLRIQTRKDCSQDRKNRVLQPVYLEYKLKEKRAKRMKDMEPMYILPLTRSAAPQMKSKTTPKNIPKEIRNKLMEYGKVQHLPKITNILKPNMPMTTNTTEHNISYNFSNEISSYENETPSLPEQPEYYQMIVDNDNELIKNYLIPPHSVCNRPTQKKKITMRKESQKQIINLRDLLDKEDVNEYRSRIMDRNEIAKSRKFSASYAEVSRIIKERNSTNHETIEKYKQQNIENPVEKRAKELRVYVVDNMKTLKKLNNNMQNNFNEYFEYFGNIEYN
jgi:hypothetical protein